MVQLLKDLRVKENCKNKYKIGSLNINTKAGPKLRFFRLLETKTAPNTKPPASITKLCNLPKLSQNENTIYYHGTGYIL